jgi:hypothetical protein
MDIESFVVGFEKIRLRRWNNANFQKPLGGIGRESCESGLRANLRIRPRTIPGLYEHLNLLAILICNKKHLNL